MRGPPWTPGGTPGRRGSQLEHSVSSQQRREGPAWPSKCSSASRGRWPVTVLARRCIYPPRAGRPGSAPLLRPRTCGTRGSSGDTCGENAPLSPQATGKQAGSPRAPEEGCDPFCIKPDTLKGVRQSLTVTLSPAGHRITRKYSSTTVSGRFRCGQGIQKSRVVGCCSQRLGLEGTRLVSSRPVASAPDTWPGRAHCPARDQHTQIRPRVGLHSTRLRLVQPITRSRAPRAFLLRFSENISSPKFTQIQGR